MSKKIIHFDNEQDINHMSSEKYEESAYNLNLDLLTISSTNREKQANRNLSAKGQDGGACITCYKTSWVEPKLLTPVRNGSSKSRNLQDKTLKKWLLSGVPVMKKASQ